MNCKYCGEKIEKESKFCKACGAQIDEVKEAIIEEKNLDNNTTSVKDANSILASGIVVTILSLLGANPISIILGILTIVFACISNSEKTVEGKLSKKKLAKIFNIISWVAYGLGIVIIIVVALLVIVPLVFVADKAVDYAENYRENIQIEEKEEYVADDSYDNLLTISYDEFLDLYKDNEKSIVVIVQTNCGYCNLYKPIIDELAYNEELDIHILDITTLTEEEYNNMLNDIDYFKSTDYWGTPTTLIVSSSKTLGHLEGYTDYSNTLEFYKQNSMVK